MIVAICMHAVNLIPRPLPPAVLDWFQCAHMGGKAQEILHTGSNQILHVTVDWEQGYMCIDVYVAKIHQFFFVLSHLGTTTMVWQKRVTVEGY